ncbi:MAG: family 1 glycosylhydrolase [Candidatus Saccharimonadales bacterium]
MQKQPKTKLQFPKRFLWGAATAAHQVEGDNHNQWSVWELENAKTKAAQSEYQLHDLDNWPDIKSAAKRPDNYVSGSLADHYNQYEQDFDLLTKMHMNAYRFSVEWSRIEPEQGVWDAAAIDHYKRYVVALRKRNIEPVMTLFHFTLPAWFSERGGFEKRSNVMYFTRFAEKIVSELGKDIRFIITINEPDIYARESYRAGNWPPNRTSNWQMFRVLNNLAYAHRQVAKRLHGMNRRYKVSIAKNSAYSYAGDTAWLSHASAAVLQYMQDDYFLRKVVKHCDFLGVNYYFSNRVYGYRVHNPDIKVSDLGWDMSPSNIEYALERLYEKYKLPIIVTENGVADQGDEYRQWWITQTLAGMQRALDSGVDIQGYLHWSLLDNFEWAHGKWPRFGLAAVDYETGNRTLRPSAIWFGRVIKHLRETK